MTSKADEIRNMTNKEIAEKIISLTRELRLLEIQMELGQLKNTAQLKLLRRSIARHKTILTEKENEKKNIEDKRDTEHKDQKGGDDE